MTSILTDIKVLLGIGEDVHFDKELIIFINSSLMALMQIGVGPLSGFRITGYSETWNNLLDARQDLELVKTYIFLKVKLLFDPSASSILTATIEKEIQMMEWRINTQVEEFVKEVVVINEDL